MGRGSSPSRAGTTPPRSSTTATCSTAARDAGVAPWVCLHHFTLPRWFADDGGFLVEANRTQAWARHVDFVAETFGDLVGGWQPVNETNYYALLAYGGRGWPPGHNDRTNGPLADEAIQLATAEAAVRLRQTGAPVASIFGLSPIVAQDDDPASLAAVTASTTRCGRPGLGLFRDGVLRVPAATPVERPDLAGAFDLIGFSYYASDRRPPAARQPPHPTARRCRRSATASGPTASASCSTACTPSCPARRCSSPSTASAPTTTTQRAAYLQRGLEIVHDAIDRGIDVRGLLPLDRRRQLRVAPRLRRPFGIIDRDRNVKPSAAVLERQTVH